jgi:ATP synthase protein I
MDQFTRTILFRAAFPTAVVGLVVAAIAWIFMGTTAGVGALIGVVFVVPFFSIGQVILASVLRKNPAMGMSVAMLLYLVKIGVLAMLLVVLADTSLFDTKAFAINILICTLVWTGAEVWILASSKILYVDPDNVPEPTTTESELAQHD